MIRLLILVILSLAFGTDTNGQDFIFIGESSYPSTEKYILKSNTENRRIPDLKIIFARDGEKRLIVVSSKLSDAVKIADKLIIYLDDGTVISCIDRGINDNVDDNAISVYYLTQAELKKIKGSNINTVRYQIVCPICGPINAWEGTYSASNVGRSRIDFSEVVTAFFDK